MRGLYVIFLISCFFPYIQIVPLGTDSQPYGLAFGLVIIFLKRIRHLNKDLFLLFTVAVAAIICVLFSPLNFNSVRSVLNYTSLFVVSTASYLVLRDGKILKLSFFKKCVYVWLFVALIQQFVYRRFAVSLIPRLAIGTEASARGVCSLAPEPTFYAIICVLLSIICYLNFRQEKDYRRIQWLLLLQTVILSRSATIIMVGLVAFIIYELLYNMRQNARNILIVPLVLVSMFIVLQTILPYISQYRVGALFAKLFQDPLMFVTVDESVNERFIHAFFPIYGFFQDFGIPHFYGNFQEYMNEIHSCGDFNKYIPYLKGNYLRIMSGLGCLLFELGIFGLPLIYVIYRNFKILAQRNKWALFFGILLFGTLLNALPLSNALLGFVVGNIIYKSERKSQCLC